MAGSKPVWKEDHIQADYELSGFSIWIWKWDLFVEFLPMRSPRLITKSAGFSISLSLHIQGGHSVCGLSVIHLPKVYFSMDIVHSLLIRVVKYLLSSCVLQIICGKGLKYKILSQWPWMWWMVWYYCLNIFSEFIL